jgi:hypothetical protein
VESATLLATEAAKKVCCNDGACCAEWSLLCWREYVGMSKEQMSTESTESTISTNDE